MTTEPAGADVAIRRLPNAHVWFPLRTRRRSRRPYSANAHPPASVEAGFQAIEGSGAPGRCAATGWIRSDAVPAGMVRVVDGRDPVRFGPIGDRSRFLASIDSRSRIGNSRIRGSRRLPHPRAIGASHSSKAGGGCRGKMRSRDFVTAPDSPGQRRGRLERIAAGQADFPVGGVSWYEAVGVRGVRGQEPAHDLSLVSCGRPRALR